MKSIALWCLITANAALLACLIGRYTKPNAAIAQAARPGDYMVIPVDFPGANTGYVVVLDNVTGEMSAIATDENQKKIYSLPRVNVADLFDAAAGRRRTR
ncbi:MAG: hypothetical protein ACTHM6_15175 [Tepidisphaeraceae bacterium]